MFFWKVRFVILLVVSNFSWSWSLETENVKVVQTPLGRIRGTVMTSSKNQSFYAFRGVPYAKPPTGERRFRPPLPIEPWNDTFDGTKDGFICPQYDPRIEKNLMSEDCLTLNVYTKNIKGSAAVMFYIHGGKFEYGGSHSEIFWGPQYLMDKDIVLVTINYRLGALGFLSTNTVDASGNFALKDQVLALKWVQENIRSFGGDQTQVTLWGHSSGSMCASLHLASPMSKGLFHRVIAMSGSAISHILPKNQESTKMLAARLECPTESPKLLVDCLRNISINGILRESDSLGTKELSTIHWFYEIENDFGQERFLLENPSISYSRGRIAKVPILTGITKDELLSRAYMIYNNTELLKKFNDDFYKLAPEAFNYSPEKIFVTNVLISTYLNYEKISFDNLKQFGQIYSHANIMHGVHRFATLAKKYTEIYYFRFDFKGRYTQGLYGSNNKPIGVHHSDDLLYLFVHTSAAPMFTANDPEYAMVEKLTELWTTFARTGNPNNFVNMDTENIYWEPFKKNDLKVLYINEKDRLLEEPDQYYMRMWDILFPIRKNS